MGNLILLGKSPDVDLDDLIGLKVAGGILINPVFVGHRSGPMHKTFQEVLFERGRVEKPGTLGQMPYSAAADTEDQ